MIANRNVKISLGILLLLVTAGGCGREKSRPPGSPQKSGTQVAGKSKPAQPGGKTTTPDGAHKRVGKENPRRTAHPLRTILLHIHTANVNGDSFVTADSDGTGKGKRGLSWRVHIARQMEGYGFPLPDGLNFKLDEPWDSPHNRKLIPKMPDYFRTPGVDKPGYTSMHVFVGRGTPFGGKRGIRLFEVRDPKSKTILIVIAGPDKAVPWTQPGGLKFDPDRDPRKLLGRLSGGVFIAGMADGSVRKLSANIDAETLRRLVQHADGKPVGDIGAGSGSDKE